MLPKPKPRRRKHCPVPKSTFTTYMDEGLMHYRAGHFRKSLFCFDRALEISPTNKGALVARSQCHLKLGDASKALQDAEYSFDKNDTYIMGLYWYAEALFNLGQFEKALIAYHWGYRSRRDMEGFRLGIQRSQEAIQTAVGDRQATQIEDLDVILPLIAEVESLLNQKKDHCCIRPSSKEQQNERLAFESRKPPSKARARWVDHEILGQLQKDKDYLSKFLFRPDVQSDQGGSDHLRNSAKEALNYLEIREQFWRQQYPMYARKIGLNFNNDMVIQYELQEEARQEASRRIKMDAAEGAVLKNLFLIKHALKIGRAKDCELECERTMRQMKEINTRLLPKKPELMCEVLHFKGLALMKLKQFDEAAVSFQRELFVATENHKSDTKSRALDHLGKAYALKGSFADAAEIWDNLLSLAKQPLERSHLFHEIGRCYLEMNKPDICKFYANQSLEEAGKCGDDIWAMNAYILLGQCDVKTMHLESAASHLKNAEDKAAKCGNKANLTLLTECNQCIKVWQEKLENSPANSTTGTHKIGSENDGAANRKTLSQTNQNEQDDM